MDLSNEVLQNFQKFAVQTAIEAGDISLKYFKKNINIDIKADNSPVTIADRETESFIREKIQEQYPDHSIIGEEEGYEERSSSFKWVIDPIDGTKSFIYGIPLYTVLIALIHNDSSCMGVIHNPVLQETITAASGLGCYYNGKPCHVSDTSDLSDARLQITDCGDLIRRHPEFTSHLISRVKLCRTWGDAYGYLLVATGKSDIMIDPILSIWDIAPLKPIITEAGGTFTDFTGKVDGLGTSAIATNGKIHDEILSLLK